MQKTTILGILTYITVTASSTLYAENNLCEIQVAVASHALTLDTSVSFNITNEEGTSKSFILPAGNPAKIITTISCSPYPYSISATAFSDWFHYGLAAQAIGECSLKAGYVLLQTPNSSASVVFPHDFVCNG